MQPTLQSTGFSVVLVGARGDTTRACRNVDKKTAAKEFWHRTHNISAMAGITQRAYIEDHNGFTVLAWDFGKGYTYDGEIYTAVPVLETEVPNYAKTKN